MRPQQLKTIEATRGGVLAGSRWPRVAIVAITDNPLDYYLVFCQCVFFTMALAVVATGGQPTLGGGVPLGQMALAEG